MNERTNRICTGKSLMLILLLISFLSAQAQEDYKERMRKQYETFQKHAATTYSNFRQKANAQYAEFMRKNWEQFHFRCDTLLRSGEAH